MDLIKWLTKLRKDSSWCTAGTCNPHLNMKSHVCTAIRDSKKQTANELKAENMQMMLQWLHLRNSAVLLQFSIGDMGKDCELLQT